MPPHSLNVSEIQKYYQNELKFNSVYSRINSMKIKNGIYVINLHEYKSRRTYWIALYINAENVTYFDGFGVKHNFEKKLKTL